MAQLENTIIARYEGKGEKFEVIVDPKNAYAYKTGMKKDLNNVLIVEEVFSDAKKGERQSSEAIKKTFGTTEIEKVAEIILKRGELQITTEQKRQLLEEKRKKIVELIARNCMDPRTKAPHPTARIENALEQAKFSVDAFKPAEEQMEDAIEKIREILPISFEKLKIAVKIPAEYSAKCYGMLKSYGIRQEEYANDGSLLAMIEIPAGLQSEFYDKLNKLTGGNANTRILS